MVSIHHLGFPRIGAQRELKFALESYWRGESERAQLLAVGARLRQQNWQRQADLDLQSVGDFSFYDQVLDASLLWGVLPARARRPGAHLLDDYFRAARGRSADLAEGVAAGQMTKWFDTNYHYIVPELSADSEFHLQPDLYLAQVREAQQQGHRVKAVLIGPVTYLYLGRGGDAAARAALLPRLLPLYQDLLRQLQELGVAWVQMDEPALVTDLEDCWWRAYDQAYSVLPAAGPQMLLSTYFGGVGEHYQRICRWPLHGLHIDAVRAPEQVALWAAVWPKDRVLSLGVIDGRNIWRSDLSALLDRLEPIHAERGERLWLAPSCSLLHVPVDLRSESGLDPELKSWCAFAQEKLEELQILAQALRSGRAAVAAQLAAADQALAARRSSPRVHDASVAAALREMATLRQQRHSPFAARSQLQQVRWPRPLYPTTTIGSFPQTEEIRAVRSRHRRGEIDTAEYTRQMQAQIAHCVAEQEKLGLDVLVHGEAERNDMVEYFAEFLQGFAFSSHAWVQSYGSRCVKPPILFGDVRRPAPMTVAWAQYAQSLTDKPMKGMLTGPVTLLNWSFVRDDQPRATTCLQLALAVRAEVLDLEAAGLPIIQIDEAALREGLPLRRKDWPAYLDNAVAAFALAAHGVHDATQIHTHMCYSEFGDIMESIIAMDADVITIETARSAMQLLDAFDTLHYPNDIGPGVYDIHAPNLPSDEQIEELLRAAGRRIPADRLWVNPDCGLKTRRWPEVLPALATLVRVARRLRQEAVAQPALV